MSCNSFGSEVEFGTPIGVNCATESVSLLHRRPIEIQQYFHLGRRRQREELPTGASLVVPSILWAARVETPTQGTLEILLAPVGGIGHLIPADGECARPGLNKGRTGLSGRTSSLRWVIATRVMAVNRAGDAAWALGYTLDT